MKQEHKTIIDIIKAYLDDHPDQRFGQALFNLRINEFQKTTDPRNPNYNLRDIYNDGDEEIVERIQSQLEWFELQRIVMSGVEKVEGLGGMTVNERLYLTGLTEKFDLYKRTNKEYARFILKSMKVDSESIDVILEEKSS